MTAPPMPLNAITQTNHPQLADLLSLGDLGVFIVKETLGFVPNENIAAWRLKGFEVVFTVSKEDYEWGKVLQIKGVWKGIETVLLLDGNPIEIMMASNAEEFKGYSKEEPFWVTCVS